MAAARIARAAGAAAAAAAPILRRIPSSGEELPVIGLGTSGPFEVDGSEAKRAPLREVLGGVLRRRRAPHRHLADVFDRRSRARGSAHAADAPARVSGHQGVDPRARAAGIEQMQRSAQLLRTQRLDLIQVHNLLDLDTHLKTLRAWKAAGRVRYVGVTHYTVSAHPELERVLAREPLDFVQFNYSPVTRAAEQRLLPLAAERGVAVLVNRPFEDGALFQRVRGKALPAWAAELGVTSWGQLALKFIAAHPAVTCIIPATDKVAHLEDNLVAGRGPLPDARQREAIAQAFA